MARILIATYSMYGAWFSIQMEAEGHNVDVWLIDHYDDYSGVLSGLIKTPLRAKPSFKRYDLVIFDLTGRPKIAESIISEGLPVIGDGDFNSEIEDNRLLGINIMEECGINVPFYEEFNDIGEAKRFIRKTNKRYVFKPFGGQDQETASTYVSKSAEDMLKYLDKLSSIAKGAEFILQEVVQGTEVSTEAWFNGSEFFLINGTLEEKKFMSGGVGPNTGCSGNLVWIYDQLNPPLVFREGLGKLKDYLQGYGYRGMIDLNTIVSDTEVFGLEWTPRFGYDASATLFTCIKDVGNFIGTIATGGTPDDSFIGTFAAGTRLSIPPYPSEIHGKHPEEVPIEGIEEDDISKNCFLYDCCLDRSDSLITCGVNGFIGVPIYAGGTPKQVWSLVKEKVKKIHIPDMQYRNDMEEETIKRYEILARQGWLR